MRRRGPSIADVARLAGVSGQTVSRVANDRPNVDAATRDRVLAAMREVAGGVWTHSHEFRIDDHHERWPR